MNSNNLELKLQRLTKQNEILKNKLFLLHEYIISKENETKFDTSKINPYEIDNKSSTKTIVAFSGMLTSLAMPKAEFFRSLNSVGVNIIFLKDFHQCWYQKGLLGVSSDVATTLDFLRSIIPPETEELYCLGTSSGGFAAILFGNLLSAKKTLSFSPQTYIDQKVFMKFRTPESRWDDMKESNYLDVKKYINGTTENDIYYGLGNELDSHFAEQLKNSQNCNLNLLDTESHNVAKYLKDCERLDEIIGNLIS